MEIKTQVYKRVVAVTVTGRVDSATAGDLEAALTGLSGEAGGNLILDLGGVDFLSSSGLRVLVTTLKNVRKTGGDVRLASPSQRAIDAINLAGLDVLFKVFPDREAAIASY